MNILNGRILSFKICIVLCGLLTIAACQESAKTAIPKLTKDLSSKNSHTRNQAALKLAGYGKDADPAVPNLIYLLRDPNGGVRSSAAFALRSIENKKGLDAIEAYQK